MSKFLGQSGHWRGGHRVFPTLKEGFENFVPDGGDPIFEWLLKLFSKLLLFFIIIGMFRECAGCGGKKDEVFVFENKDAKVELEYYKVDTISDMIAGNLEFDYGFQKFADERIYYEMERRFEGTKKGNTLYIVLLDEPESPRIESSEGIDILVDPNMIISLDQGSTITLMNQTMTLKK